MSVTSQSRSALSRTPHGVRGLKFNFFAAPGILCVSHPSRGAWIEITCIIDLSDGHRRTPHGVRGLKSRLQRAGRAYRCRTPHGVRGLKWRGHGSGDGKTRSHPSRGAWIEILSIICCTTDMPRRTPHGVRGLKYHVGKAGRCHNCRTPHGVRGLKSGRAQYHARRRPVAPLTGCVD